MRKFTLMLLILLFAGLQIALAQKKTISGVITAKDDGATIPGVTVVVKGTAVGTTSDANGKYTIVVPEKSTTLVFSFVGMKTQEIEVTQSATINIVMETDVMNIEGVVVTAIGISRETKALGYSVQGVEGEAIEKSNTTNVVNALNGKVAGVSVTSGSGAAGGSAFINIRGASSITGANQPLFVVDGIPIDNSQYYSGNPDNGTNNLTEGVAYSNRAIDLNPDDIESMTVLKGGAATALYGLRAANGVVIVTTKKGKAVAGTKAKVYNVNFTTSVSIDKVNKMPEYQTKYGQGLNGKWSGPETANRNTWGPMLDTCSYTNVGLTASQDVNNDGIYDWDYNGKIVSANDPNATGAEVVPYDNLGTFFKTGYTYNNALNIAGGGENATYYMSFSNSQTDGIIPNNSFDKTTVKVSGETKLSSKFIASGSVNYIKSGGDRIQQGSNLSGLMLGLLRTPCSFDNANGFDDPVNTPEAYLFADGSQRSYRGYGIYDNPYFTVNENAFRDDVNRMLGNVQLTYLPLSWLNITYRLGTDFYSDRRKAHFAKNSSAYPDGMIFEDQHYNRDFNSDLIATVTKDLNKNFKLNFILGQNMFQTYHQQLYVEGNQLTLPGFYQMSNASTITTRENQAKKRTAAIYGDLGLSYQSMLFLDITGRNEWSTTLPEGKNSFFFPSFSLGFVFTELGALKDNKIMPFGKLRASYAIIANDAPVYYTGNYYSLGYYGDGWTSGVSFPFGGYTGYMVSDALGSDVLEPERLKSFEVGLDLRFLENRIGLDIAYYNNINDKLILAVPVAGSSGYTVAVMNAATMKNTGIELLATGTPVKTKNGKVQWDITLNFTKNTNEVVELAEGIENVGLGGFTGSEIRAVAGKPYGSIFGTQWVKDGDGNIIINDDPSDPNYGRPIMSDEEGYLGTVQPDWTMGITNALQVYGFNLSFLVDIKKGGVMWNGTKGIMYALGTHIDTETRGESVVMDGIMGHLDANGDLVSTGVDNTIETKLDQSWYNGLGGGFGGPTEQFIEEADWVRLREVNLTYSLNSKWLSKTFFKGIDLFVAARNLWMWTPYTGIDPETNLYGASNAQGIDYFNMPNTRTYTFGLKVQL